MIEEKINLSQRLKDLPKEKQTVITFFPRVSLGKENGAYVEPAIDDYTALGHMNRETLMLNWMNTFGVPAPHDFCAEKVGNKYRFNAMLIDFDAYELLRHSTDKTLKKLLTSSAATTYQVMHFREYLEDALNSELPDDSLSQFRVKQNDVWKDFDTKLQVIAVTRGNTLEIVNSHHQANIKKLLNVMSRLGFVCPKLDSLKDTCSIIIKETKIDCNDAEKIEELG